MKTLHAVVTGRVQGVFFRAWTRDQARRLGLTGWVCNLPDGNVETMAQGTDDALGRFLDFLHQGPRLARVDRVDSVFIEGREAMSGFEVVTTKV